MCAVSLPNTQAQGQSLTSRMAYDDISLRRGSPARCSPRMSAEISLGSLLLHGGIIWGTVSDLWRDLFPLYLSHSIYRMDTVTLWIVFLSKH